MIACVADSVLDFFIPVGVFMVLGMGLYVLAQIVKSINEDTHA